jgi:hypothetical protein
VAKTFKSMSESRRVRLGEQKPAISESRKIKLGLFLSK